MASNADSADADFVDTVMSSQKNGGELQNTPTNGAVAVTVTDTRKRHLSLDSGDEIPSKRGPGAQTSRENRENKP